MLNVFHPLLNPLPHIQTIAKVLLRAIIGQAIDDIQELLLEG
jgi:hypothetical protein